MIDWVTFFHNFYYILAVSLFVYIIFVSFQNFKMTHRNDHIILDDIDEQGQHFESIGSPTSPISPTSNVPTNNNTTLSSNPSFTNKKLIKWSLENFW